MPTTHMNTFIYLIQGFLFSGLLAAIQKEHLAFYNGAYATTYQAVQQKQRDTIYGKVTRIIDGDTFDVLTKQKNLVRVRMYGIDCPERRQDFYEVCKQALASMIAGKDVHLINRGYDRNKRLLAEVLAQQKNINIAMIENGYAWHFKKYSTDILYAEAEHKARKASQGLWIKPDAIAPWEFRAKYKK